MSDLKSNASHEDLLLFSEVSSFSMLQYIYEKTFPLTPCSGACSDANIRHRSLLAAVQPSARENVPQVVSIGKPVLLLTLAHRGKGVYRRYASAAR